MHSVADPFPMTVAYELADEGDAPACAFASAATRPASTGWPLLNRAAARSIAADLRRLKELLER